MIDISQLTQLFEKAIFIIGAILYLFYAGVVVKQVSMLTKNVNDKFNSILIFFSYGHLLFAVGLVLLTIFLL
ncbi:MAG TPA: hypothetical protein PK639_00055 [Candidatus Woesebacteria bacterium]|nr:hypothetical protein [Candidatus Woesebacteria bacterium]